MAFYQVVSFNLVGLELGQPTFRTPDDEPMLDKVVYVVEVELETVT